MSDETPHPPVDGPEAMDDGPSADSPAPLVPAAPPAPAAPAGSYLDAVSGVTLPAGVTLASHGRRIGAYFLAIPLSIVTLGIGYLIWGAIVWGRGTSPALQVLGMKVYRPITNARATWGTMALRDIVGSFVTGILGPITGIVSLVLFLAGRERKTICDHIASTVVVYDPSNVLG